MSDAVLTAVLPALIGGAPGTAAFVIVLVTVLRRPPAVALLDKSVEAWVDRLESALDQCERRELVREANDALHRAWDSNLLLIMATSADLAEARHRVEELGPPPRLSPEPSEWLMARASAGRQHARRRAASLGPEVGLPAPR